MDPRSVVPLAMFPQNLIHVGEYWSKRAFGGHQHLELVKPRWAVHLRASAAVPDGALFIDGRRFFIHMTESQYNHGGESESGQMVLKKLKWTYFDAYL